MLSRMGTPLALTFDPRTVLARGKKVLQLASAPGCHVLEGPRSSNATTAKDLKGEGCPDATTRRVLACLATSFLGHATDEVHLPIRALVALTFYVLWLTEVSAIPEIFRLGVHVCSDCLRFRVREERLRPLTERGNCSKTSWFRGWEISVCVHSIAWIDRGQERKPESKLPMQQKCHSFCSGLQMMGAAVLGLQSNTCYFA
ncbi:unnamed protein product [Sphagnum compactum]